MSETKNVVIQQNNGIDYDVLKPLRSIDDKLFGYWWKRVGFSSELTERKDTTVSSESSSASNHVFVVTTYYSNTLFYSSSGSLTTSGMSAQTIQMWLNREVGSSNVEVIFDKTPSNYSGKYIYCNRNYFCATTDQKGQSKVPIYINGRGYWDSSGGGGYGVYYGSWYLTTSSSYRSLYWWTVNGKTDTVDYVYSSDRNKYPDSGIENNYGYNFLGVPFSNALLLSKSDIQV